MAVGLVGRKCGMSRIFTEDGISSPVTVIQIDSNRITQIKTEKIDGYSGIQVTIGTKKTSRVNKAEAGHFLKANTVAGVGLWEFRVEENDISDFDIGAEVTVDLFSTGQRVDVKGISIGKGFAGGVKRHNFRMQDATHGNSLSHRAPGSIGQCQTPGRVFKGKKMAGHMGAENCTVQNLTVLGVEKENSLLLIKGAVPGSKGGKVVITPAKKG
ncbi:MAG: 50S ribosomal protein L3 [Methylococcales bacterium]